MLKWRDLDFFFETNKEGPYVKSRLSTICNDDNNNRLTVWTLTCRLGKFRKSDEFFTYIYIYIKDEENTIYLALRVSCY